MAVEGEGTAFEVVRVSGATDAEVSAAWLAVRSKGVGGSDVAAVMGLSPYRGAYEVWAEKSGLAAPADLSGVGAVEWGNRLEPLVAQKYRDEHPDRLVRRLNGVLRSTARPWAQASLDYEVRDPDLGWGVLEVKTVGWRRAADWDDGVPLYYLTQVAHYLGVTGRPFADVAVLVAGQEYRDYRVARDEGDVAAVAGAVDAFWRSVVDGLPPDPTATASAALLSAHPVPSGGYEEAGACPELDSWLAAKAEHDAARARLDGAAALLKARVGDARGIEVPSGRLTWARGSARRFDRARFDADHPGVYESYCEDAPRDMGLRWRER